MHSMDVLVSLVSLLLVAGAGASSPANSEAAMEYWKTELPKTPMPPAILDLLTPSAGVRTIRGPKDFKFVKEPRKIGPNSQRVKSEAGHQAARNLHVEENLKEISVSYGSQGEEDGSYAKNDFEKLLYSNRPQVVENLKEISVKYGSQGEDDPQMEENLKEISVSYGSRGEDDVKKISMSYGLEGEEDIKKISMSYGLEGEEGLKTISVSYGSKEGKDDGNNVLYEGEEDPNKISMSYGSGHEEDVKKISMEYGSHAEGEKKLAFFDNLLHKLIERSTASRARPFTLSSRGKQATGEGHNYHVHAHNHNHNVNVNKRVADVFFFHDMLRPGNIITPTIPPTTSLPAFLPRRVAASLPFSTERLADIVAMFAPASLAMAGEMRWTLDTCERPRPLPGQRAGCATSVESLADLAAALLGTRDVRSFSAGDVPVEAPGTPALRGRYNVTAVRWLSAGAGAGSSDSDEVVICHDLTYPYAVFYCHTAGPTAAYAVTLRATGEDHNGAAAPAVMEALAVCHLDTSRWDPRNPFFEVNGVKPGDVAVCHFLTKLSVVWVRAGAGAGEQGDAAASQ